MKCETVFSELTNEFLFCHANTLDSLPNDEYTHRHTRTHTDSLVISLSASGNCTCMRWR